MSFGMSGRVFHAPFIHSSQKFVLRAVTERSSKTARLIYPDVISYDSLDELLADPYIELIIVNTPNNTHYDFTKQALEAGKHVLVEKPFAATVNEAVEIFKLARGRNLKVLVYQNRRWDSDFLSVKSVLETGRLGNIIEAHFRFDRYKNEISIKKFKELPLPASGLTYDLGPHILDQAISLFGRPDSYNKTTGTFRKNSIVDDYVHIHLKYRTGQNIFVTASLLTASPLPSFVLHGTRGSYIKSRVDVQEDQLQAGISPIDDHYGIERNGVEGKLTLVDDSGKPGIEYITSLRGSYSGLFNHVYDSIRKEEAFPVTEEQILLQLEILGSEST